MRWPGAFKRSTRFWVGISCTVFVVAVCSARLISVGATPKDSGPKTNGFVVSHLIPAVYDGDDACPQGLAEGPDEDAVLSKFTPKERARLRRPENAIELSFVMRHRGPFGIDVCYAPYAVSDPGLR